MCHHISPFLAMALAARCDALVSGDKDLFTLQQSFAVPILSPAEFLERLVPLDHDPTQLLHLRRPPNHNPTAIGC